MERYSVLLSKLQQHAVKSQSNALVLQSDNITRGRPMARGNEENLQGLCVCRNCSCLKQYEFGDRQESKVKFIFRNFFNKDEALF